ncbi:hypothetical protein [Saccharopolyspora sp. CA-218241]|uniref:hypothetical protein n=1 Tax=Saccharopolyspora sp. CA-218241 TaxID=3240027 RepID=UPI003D98AD19
MIRKGLLFAVMLGALALSFAGQKHAVTPHLGAELAVVFALTNDLATLLALHEVTSATQTKTRRWAWAVLLLAGGTGLGLNTWDALRAGTLPAPAAVVVGAGPVVLAWVLSHLVALVLAERRGAATTEAGSAPAVAVAPTAPATPERTAEAPMRAAAEPAREAAVSAPESAPAADQEPDPDRTPLHVVEAGSGEREALTAASEPAPDPLPIDLIDRAERLERKRLTETGGKRGLAYREAPRRLGVRYETARAALDAARARMAADTHQIAA